MKRVVLYNPQAVFFDMPLALLSIASCLDPKEYELQIIDARVEKNADQMVVDACSDAICLGITALSGAPLKNALRISRLVYETNSTLPVIWGGWHPSLFPTELLEEEPSIDISVYGQGESTFKELVETFTALGSVEKVKGIAYRQKDGTIKKNPARLLDDMDALPPVNYDLIDVEKYFKAKGKRQFDYISSTGCFFRCAFCADPFVFKRKWTSISAERMVNEIAMWYEKFKFTDLNLQGETFFTYQNRSMEIANRLIEKDINVSWAATMRADQGIRLSEEDFVTLKRSGLRRVLIGVESGSREMMDWLKKDIKMEHVLECADRCKRYDISVIFPFIVGFPGETDKSVQSSIDMVKLLRSKSSSFQTPIFYFKPYPGSDIAKQVVKEGYQLPSDLGAWSDFDYVDSKGGPWVSEEKYKLIENFKFYANIAWHKKHKLAAPIKKIAGWRCKNDNYRLPFEKVIINKLFPKVELS